MTTKKSTTCCSCICSRAASTKLGYREHISGSNTILYETGDEEERVCRPFRRRIKHHCNIKHHTRLDCGLVERSPTPKHGLLARRRRHHRRRVLLGSMRPRPRRTPAHPHSIRITIGSAPRTREITRRLNFSVTYDDVIARAIANGLLRAQREYQFIDLPVLYYSGKYRINVITQPKKYFNMVIIICRNVTTCDDIIKICRFYKRLCV